MLVNRLVHRAGATRWHIAAVEHTVPEGTWLWLEAGCGVDFDARVVLDGLAGFRERYPGATICTDCLEVYTTGLETAWQEEG